MKKYLVAFFMILITSTSHALFNAWHVRADDGCAKYGRFMNKDEYYFCGSHAFSCAGDPIEQSEIKNGHVHWYNYKESESFENALYWCCNGEVTDTRALNEINKKDKVAGTPGKWVKGNEWIVSSEIKTKTVAGGTCTYTETTDICGHVHTNDGDCKNPTTASDMMTCPDGQYYRLSSGSCATLCDAGFAYESRTSNRCVECAETSTQGVAHDGGSTNPDDLADPMHLICRKCNTATQLFNPSTRQCVEKTNTSSTTALSMNDLLYGIGRSKRINVSDNCWTKYGEEYKNCVLNK